MPFDILTAKHVLCVVAHYDDEALFFGGTLDRLATAGAKIAILVLTDVAFCNPPMTFDRKQCEMDRRNARLRAFQNVCRKLNAVQYHLLLPQGETLGPRDVAENLQKATAGVVEVMRRHKTQLVLTHGPRGDHMAPKYADGRRVARCQHILAHDAVRQAFAKLESPPPMLAWVDPVGPIVIPIFLAAKMDLLNYYHAGTTQESTWDFMANYPEWVTHEECYSTSH